MREHDQVQVLTAPSRSCWKNNKPDCTTSPLSSLVNKRWEMIVLLLSDPIPSSVTETERLAIILSGTVILISFLAPLVQAPMLHFHRRLKKIIIVIYVSNAFGHGIPLLIEYGHGKNARRQFLSGNRQAYK